MDTSSNSTQQTSKWVWVLVAILALTVIFQAVSINQLGKRQEALEKKHSRVLSEDSSSSPAYSTRKPRGFSSRSAAHTPISPAFQNDPWEEMDRMSQRMNNLMQHAFMFGSPLFQNLPQESGFDFTPAVDLEETSDAYIVKSDLPGLEKDKINLTVKENVLTIEGSRETTQQSKDQQNGYFTQERSYGSFARSLSLPGPVDDSKISAEYKNGVLVIKLPKAANQKSSQKVAIQ